METLLFFQLSVLVKISLNKNRTIGIENAQNIYSIRGMHWKNPKNELNPLILPIQHQLYQWKAIWKRTLLTPCSAWTSSALLAVLQTWVQQQYTSSINFQVSLTMNSGLHDTCPFSMNPLYNILWILFHYQILWNKFLRIIALYLIGNLRFSMVKLVGQRHKCSLVAPYIKERGFLPWTSLFYIKVRNFRTR